LEAIYPSDIKFKQVTAKHLGKKYPEIFFDWTNKHWTFYYDLTIHKKVSFTELHYNFKYLNN